MTQHEFTLMVHLITVTFAIFHKITIKYNLMNNMIIQILLIIIIYILIK